MVACVQLTASQGAWCLLVDLPEIQFHSLQVLLFDRMCHLSRGERGVSVFVA